MPVSNEVAVLLLPVLEEDKVRSDAKSSLAISSSTLARPARNPAPPSESKDPLAPLSPAVPAVAVAVRLEGVEDEVEVELEKDPFPLWLPF